MEPLVLALPGGEQIEIDELIKSRQDSQTDSFFFINTVFEAPYTAGQWFGSLQKSTLYFTPGVFNLF